MRHARRDSAVASGLLILWQSPIEHHPCRKLSYVEILFMKSA